MDVDKAASHDGLVDYWLGGTKYTIPQESVDKIEHSGGPSITVGPAIPTNMVPSSMGKDTGRPPEAPSPARSARSKVAVPVPVLGQDDPAWNALRAQIVDGDRVDENALDGIERKKDSRQTAHAYFVAAIFELQHGDTESASRHLAHAVSVSPNEGWLLGWHASVLASLGRFSEGASQAELLVKLEPQSSDAFRLLGALQYNADHTRDAVRSWQRAQQLSPDPQVQEHLDRAQKELELEDRFSQQESLHFSLRYEGAQTSLALQQDILGVLEEQFRELTRDLDFIPTENIIVTLYTQKQFFDITQAPAWAGGLNDGKLRIPIQGISTVTLELRHVLKHELTHSFIRFMVHQRCPAWLNEGLAQLMEPRSSSPQDSAFLSALFARRRGIPFSVLEGPFNGFTTLQAHVAYAQSLAAVEYLRSKYGMDDVLRIVRRIGSGETPEGALRSVTRTDYEDLSKALGGYLAQAGGR